jgi:hypothetical protein
LFIYFTHSSLLHFIVSHEKGYQVYLTMATEDDRALATQVVLKALEDVVQYIPGEEDEDEIGVRRVAFFNTFLKALPDHLLLWTQSVEIPEGMTASLLAPGVRLKLDLPGTIATLASEFDQSQNKVSPRLQEVVDMINSHKDVYAELHGVIPHDDPEEDGTRGNGLKIDTDLEDEAVTKVYMLLEDADRLPTRVNVKFDDNWEKRWAIKHSDGVVTYVPVDHPQVKHLEELYAAGLPITVGKVARTTPRKRKSIEDPIDESNKATPGRTTRKTSLANLMEKACADKVRDIKLLIPGRRALLQRLNPGMPESMILLRALGWAKREMEYRNRFQPSEHRDAVARNAYELLIGPVNFNLDSAQIKNVEVHYDRYLHRQHGYHIDEKRDGQHN